MYQIITDFGEPLEIFREAFQNAIDENAQKVFCHVYEKQRMSGSELIIDIWNDGNTLKKENVENFFGLAKSIKFDENNMPIKGKLGYKGHGTKIFFNARKVQICSKAGQEEWGVNLETPLLQLEEKNTFEYSDFISAIAAMIDMICSNKELNDGLRRVFYSGYDVIITYERKVLETQGLKGCYFSISSTEKGVQQMNI